MSFARRIVLDTGVLVSAAIRPHSVPALALEKALLNFDVYVSRDTLAELVPVQIIGCLGVAKLGMCIYAYTSLYIARPT